MPTTRSRSRATREPSAEELKEAIKGIYDELDDIHKFLEELAEAHDSLTDWANGLCCEHNRHMDWHLEDLLRDELDKPPTFPWLLWVWVCVCVWVFSFFNPEIGVPVLLFSSLHGFLHEFDKS